MRRIILLFGVLLVVGVLVGCNQNVEKEESVEVMMMKEDSMFGEIMAKSDLVNRLKDGGYVVYFRHAQTEKDYADQIDATMGDCSTQRALSEAGWNEAKMIGAAFEKFNIPVDKVVSSEYCRAWQTAEIAFGQHEKSSDLNFYPAEEYTDEQFAEMREKVMPMLVAKPAVGKNSVIVGHDDVFESATGIYPEPQGVAYVLQPDGEKFEIIGHLKVDEWK